MGRMPLPVVFHNASTADADLLAVTGWLTSDPMICVVDGPATTLLVADFELPTVRAQGTATVVRSLEEFGWTALRRGGLDHCGAAAVVIAALLAQLGNADVHVPWSFPTGTADLLRRKGISITPVAEPIGNRRRIKTTAEVESIAEVQRVTERSMARVRDILQQATEDADGMLRWAGAPLTSEVLHREVRLIWAADGCEGDTPIVAGGARSADAHDAGAGPLHARTPIIVDLFPRSVRSRFHADMTRTFSVGEPAAEIVEMHAACVRALDATRSMVRAGVPGREVNTRMCEVFRDAGFPSLVYPADTIDAPRDARCNHGLGHGVGLEVHEAPGLGLSGAAPLEIGDVVTLEPGLYLAGVGGVRVEDLVVVTELGCRTLTEFPYDLVI